MHSLLWAPARACIEMTGLIVDTTKPLGSAIHDHTIIGRNGK